MYPRTNLARRRGVRRLEQIRTLEKEVEYYPALVLAMEHEYDLIRSKHVGLSADYAKLKHLSGELRDRHVKLRASLEGGFWKRLRLAWCLVCGKTL